jgi:hypothetical protein
VAQQQVEFVVPVAHGDVLSRNVLGVPLYWPSSIT